MTFVMICGAFERFGRVIKIGLHILKQVALIGLKRDQIIGPAINDGPGNARITADGIDADKGTRQRALVRQPLQQGRNCHDLVRLFLRGFLPQHQLFMRGKACPERLPWQARFAVGISVALPSLIVSTSPALISS